MKIFIITTGSYSDYKIVAACSTPERAQKFIDIMEDSEDYEIEIWEIDKYDQIIDDLRSKKTFIYLVKMLRDGSVEDIHITRIDDYYMKDAMKKDFRIWDGKILGMWVLAKNEKHAIKIVNEKRVQLIATNKWVEK